MACTTNKNVYLQETFFIYGLGCGFVIAHIASHHTWSSSNLKKKTTKGKREAKGNVLLKLRRKIKSKLVRKVDGENIKSKREKKRER